MKSFTIEVYGCDTCPDADHEGSICMRYTDQNMRSTYEGVQAVYETARVIYLANALQLTDSCPRL